MESRGGLVAQDAELDGEVVGGAGLGAALSLDEGVDAFGVLLEHVELLGGELGDGAVGGGAHLEGALEAVVREEGGAKDLGKLAGGVAAQSVHLEEAVLGGDEALGDEEIVHAGGGDLGDAVGIALDGDGGGETGDGEGAVDLREGGAGGGADEVLGGEESTNAEEDG